MYPDPVIALAAELSLATVKISSSDETTHIKESVQFLHVHMCDIVPK